MAYQEPKYNINTNGKSMANVESDLNRSMLSIRFWNDILKLVFAPKLPREQWNSNNGKKHDTKNIITASFQVEKVQEILQRYFNEREMFNSENEHNITVKIGENGTLILSNGIQFGYSEPTMCLAVAQNIDGETGIPNTVIHYEFAKRSSIKNYMVSTGEFETIEMSVMDSPQFLIFLNTLKEFAVTNTMSASHNMHNGQRAMYSTIKDRMLSRNKSNNSNYFDNSNNNTKNNYGDNNNGSSATVDQMDQQGLTDAIDSLA